MTSFIKDVLLDLKNENFNFENLIFVLPSKRAGVFLKHELTVLIEKPIFSPTILSIEEFIQNLADLEPLPEAELIFILYDSYLQHTPKEEQESFESFFSWANTLLQDFNEIDRYLIDHNSIFDYLQAIKEMNHWSFEHNQTTLIKDHLKFWNRLKPIYQTFVNSLLDQRKGFQGLLYREAHSNLEIYIENHQERKHIFLGFNALNASESYVIQELLVNDMAKIYWDIDAVFMENSIHSASLFQRKYKNNWNYFKHSDFKWITHNYETSKSIKIIGIPNNIGQAKYIGQILERIKITSGDLQNVAVVLGEEQLLAPVLTALPNTISSVNVTMGLPLRYIPLAHFFRSLINLHRQGSENFYYKDVIALLGLPSVNSLFQVGPDNKAGELIQHIQKLNLVYVGKEKLKSIVPQCQSVINLIFGNWKDNAYVALNNCKALIFEIKERLNPTTDHLKLEYLYRINTLFNRLHDLLHDYSYVENISGFYSLFINLLDIETLDFKGEPLEGLQIMGMLETRVLDFDTVIISSVNEGILPAGKTISSFIPYDVKKENGLPTFKEKDAVYTYHFYRLLQRAKTVYILYNTEIDTLNGGEKSRFITQLEVEGIHPIVHFLAQPKIPSTKSTAKSVKKTPELLKSLQVLIEKGFSPSSLTSYIRNPLEFYYEKVLNIKEFEDVEERIAANTLGTVIHNTLEKLYKPFENQFLTKEVLKSFIPKVRDIISKEFSSEYGDGDFSTGKNLIIFEVAVHYVSKFITSEVKSIENGNSIKILSIESEESINIDVPDMDSPLILTGKIDRLDEFNGITRVIDYKTGRVERAKVEVQDWDALITDYDNYSKPFQLLCYTYILYKQDKIVLPVEAGIYSFKNLNSGLLKFAERSPDNRNKKTTAITEETLKAFENQLQKLILEIFNPNVEFMEKEITQWK